MADIRLRPRFREARDCTPQHVLSVLSTRLNDGSVSVRGTILQNVCVLKVPLSEARFWSPQLHVSVETAENGSAELHGLFGPMPSIWTIFVALYSAFAFLGTMGVIFGLSQIALGEAALALWAGPVSALAALIVYAVGRMGRRFGMDQMIELREFLDDALKHCDS
jgi:hypothetical protein